jgi:hypothetical protein
MTTRGAFPHAFVYRCALGPLFSNGGLKNWTLHLARGAALFRRRSGGDKPRPYEDRRL